MPSPRKLNAGNDFHCQSLIQRNSSIRVNYRQAATPVAVREASGELTLEAENLKNIFVPHFCGQPCGRSNFERAQRLARLHFLSIARFLSNAALLSLGMDDG